MADDKKDNGELSQEQRDKIVAWLQARNVPRACTACGHNNWTLGDHLVAPPVYRRNVLSIGGAAYPQVMLICKSCGNTLYFNAVIMGIVTEKEPEKKEEAPKPGGSDG